MNDLGEATVRDMSDNRQTPRSDEIDGGWGFVEVSPPQTGQTTMDTDRIADQILRLDGPYTPDETIAAVKVVAELVRRLNNATLNALVLTLPNPGNVDTVIQDLVILMERLPQLLDHIATRIDMLGGDPRVAVDQRGERDLADVVAWAVVNLREASSGVDSARKALKAVGAGTSRLMLT